MTPRRPNRRQDDPPPDPDIRRWFHALGPPPVGKAPPDLRAKVLARIEQQRARHVRWAWLPEWSPAWATACAVLLGVSLGVNVWWSMRPSGARLPSTRQSAERTPDAHSVPGGLQIYRFQAGMQHTAEVGRLIAARPVPQEPTTVVGFTPQVERTAFVRMGVLYAEILGALRAGAVEDAEQRLKLLVQMATRSQVPRALPQYLRLVQTALQSRPTEADILVRFLALFEPLYADAYATPAPVAAEVILFQAGAWLESMALAAASGDGAAVRHGGASIGVLRQALTQFHMPPEVLEGLQRLHERTAHPVVTEQDFQAVHTLVQQIQAVLGG
jgi:hypothetical protein